MPKPCTCTCHPCIFCPSVLPQASAVEALLNAGARPGTKNNDGLRPLDIALPVPWDEVVACVVSAVI